MYRPEDFPPVHLRDHLRVIRKHKWTAIMFFTFVFGLTALYLVMTQPRYRATAKLVLKPPSLSPLTMISEIVYFEGADIVSRRLFATTQFEVLASRRLAERVLDRLNLWDDYHVGEEKKGFPWEKPKVITRDMAAEAFAERVTALNPNIMSNHIEVSFSSKDPEKAARIVNTLLEVYVEMLYEDRSKRIEENLEWLRQKFKELDKDVIEADQALQDFKKETNLISLDDRENILLQRLHAINSSLLQARLARITAQNTYFEAKQLEDDPSRLERAPMILTSNPQVAALNGQLNIIRTEYARARERYKEKHPRMIELQSAIEELETRIKTEVNKAIESLRLAYETAKSQEESLMRELEEVRSQVIKLDEQKIHYYQLLDASKVNRALFDSLLGRLKETIILQNFRSPADTVQMIDRAVPPDKPSGFRNLFLPIAGGVGILLGIFLCYVKEYFDVSIQNERDIHEILRLPLLGILPQARISRFRKGDRRLEKAPLLEPDTPYVEFLHRLTNVIRHLGPREGAKTLMIASASPREGRTSLTVNLGITLAQRGEKVLLIDGDLRRPRLHEALSLDNERGLSNLLETGTDPDECIRRSEPGTLFCLPAGPCPSAPSVAVESDRVRGLMEVLRERFDWILVDSSALLEVPDATALAPSLDATLLVIASGETSKERAAWAKRSLELVDSRILGVVLNRVRFIRGVTNYYTAER